jgi:predicted GNAT family N-acyltransferase
MNTKSIICSYQDNEKDICKIRFEVFVDEQNVPEELEIDGLDDEAKHVLAYIGKLMMQELIQWAEEAKLEKLWLSSQWHAHGFYLDLGFDCEGDIYEEAGIDHIKMSKKLS